jgi:pyruvate kinase
MSVTGLRGPRVVRLMRSAKIVCTLGPATSTPARIRELIVCGDGHRSAQPLPRRTRCPRDSSTERSARRATTRATPSVSSSTCRARKSALAVSPTGPVELFAGDTFTITTDDILGDRRRVSTTFKGMPGDVRVGDLLLVDDGKVTLRAVEVTDDRHRHRGGRGRDGLQQQGHQPARRRRERAGDCRRRTRTTCAGPCGCGPT